MRTNYTLKLNNKIVMSFSADNDGEADVIMKVLEDNFDSVDILHTLELPDEPLQIVRTLPDHIDAYEARMGRSMRRVRDAFRNGGVKNIVQLYSLTAKEIDELPGVGGATYTLINDFIIWLREGARQYD